MSGDQTASLIYLVLLGTVIAGYFFASQRIRLGHGLRIAALWVLIFVGVIAAYGLWSDLQSSVLPRQSVFAEEGRVEVPRSPNGHYHMTLDINGVPVRFVVDTGATDLVLSQEDAERVGLIPTDLVYHGAAKTANGVVPTARVRLNTVALGDFVDDDVTAIVNGGEMSGSLLGMAYLNRFDEVAFGNGRMTLTR